MSKSFFGAVNLGRHTDLDYDPIATTRVHLGRVEYGHIDSDLLVDDDLEFIDIWLSFESPQIITKENFTLSESSDAFPLKIENEPFKGRLNPYYVTVVQFRVTKIIYVSSKEESFYFDIKWNFPPNTDAKKMDLDTDHYSKMIFNKMTFDLM